MNTSLTELTWNLRLLSAALYNNHPNKDVTLDEFCAAFKLPPVWTDDEEENSAVRERLIELCQPELDLGGSGWAVLDLDPKRMAKAFYLDLQKIVAILEQRQEKMREQLGLPNRAPITAEDAARIAEAARTHGISQDDFTGVLQQVFLDQIGCGLIAAAQSMVKEFLPETGRGYVFSPKGIPESWLAENADRACQNLLNYLNEDDDGAEHLETLEKFVEMTVISKAKLNERIRDLILQAVRYGNTVPEHLAQFVGVLVTPDEIAALKQERLEQEIRSMTSSYMYSCPVETADCLKAQGMPADEVDALLKEAVLRLVAARGKNHYSVKPILEKLPEGLVCQTDMEQALGQYALILAAKPNFGDDWLKDAYAHRQYFQPADYERAIKTAAYTAKHGYHGDAEKLAKIQSEHPDLDWSNLDALEPSALIGDEPLRGLLRARLADPVELTIANIIADWFTSHSSGYSTLSYHFGWLQEAMRLAIGMPKERGNDLLNAITQTIEEEDCMQGSGAELREITALLNGEKEISQEVLDRSNARLKVLREEILRRRRKVAERKNRDLAVELARAERVQRAFDYQLSAVPYAALLKVRRVVAQIVREKANQEIDND